MYVPKGHHWLGPTGVVLAGFFVNQQFLGGGFHWDYALLVQLPLSAIAYKWGQYIHDTGVIWQKWEAGEPVTEKPAATVPLNVNGETKSLAYAHVTEVPKFNPERNFYKTLINMRNSNFKVDLTEAYWIEDGNRYGAPRAEFVTMKNKGERLGALERAGQRKNAPHTVRDWRVVRMIADGAPLPHSRAG